MGYYIETDGTHNKAQWIVGSVQGALSIQQPTTLTEYTSQGYVPVCVVNNGPFEAAAICYSQSELEAFSDPHDYRSRKWVAVPTPFILSLYPDLEGRL